MAISDGGILLILGKFYSLADICEGPSIHRMEDLGYAYLWIDDLPKMTEWSKNTKSWSPYKKAYYHGSRYSKNFPE